MEQGNRAIWLRTTVTLTMGTSNVGSNPLLPQTVYTIATETLFFKFSSILVGCLRHAVHVTAHYPWLSTLFMSHVKRVRIIFSSQS